LWWIEHGGRLDTVHDTEAIKFELWRVVYGVWDYIKNSGRFPEAETLTLEWVSTIPGKRESRRFEGDYWLTQHDVIERRRHADDVSFGGWGIDLHPADGVFSDKPGCTGWHAAGVYPIPYRCLYSANLANLFLAGRLISASHVAFGSTRVMLTGAHNGQAVGLAAAICVRDGRAPRDLASGPPLAELQRNLLRSGQHIPGVARLDEANLVRQGMIEASSSLQLAALPDDGPRLALDLDTAQMLPLPAGVVPGVTMWVDAAQDTELRLELRVSTTPDTWSPQTILAAKTVAVPAGDSQAVCFDFDTRLDTARYGFFTLRSNPAVKVHTSEQRVTGVLRVRHRYDQRPPADIGVESLEMWPAERRPGGHNLALAIAPPLEGFGAAHVAGQCERPTCRANAWVAGLDDAAPRLTVTWPAPQTLERVELSFDTDFDHPMESVLYGHPERVSPFCVRHYRLRDERGEVAAEVEEQHQTRACHRFDPPLETAGLSVEVVSTWGAPAAIFALRAYSAA
jgi:hypothetical protein